MCKREMQSVVLVIEFVISASFGVFPCGRFLQRRLSLSLKLFETGGIIRHENREFWSVLASITKRLVFPAL